ncbi:MAG: polyphenol oxidase family protein [Elusimicrobiota bacterium]|nr:polyphenol oxidase family protein [Elusimicrobiota bacterium]
MWFISDGLIYNKKLLQLGIKHFVTTKIFGDMSNKTIRSTLLKSLNIDPAMFVTAEQVHSNKIHFVTSKDRGKKIRAVDGLVCGTNAALHCIVLGIFTADCVPVFIVENKKVALVHIGWRGLKAGIVDEVKKFFNNPVVCLGPHICPKCYKMDLSKEITSQLKSKGIALENIHLSDLNKFCTYHNPELFYSYHRGDKTERMLSVLSR